MFFRRHKRNLQPIQSEFDVYLSSEVVGQGKIEAIADVHVDGKFTGSIHSPGLVEIGKNAQASADIEARALIVDGTLRGSAKITEEVAIRNSADVKANITAATLVVDKNALVDGHMKVAR